MAHRHIAVHILAEDEGTCNACGDDIAVMKLIFAPTPNFSNVLRVCAECGADLQFQLTMGSEFAKRTQVRFNEADEDKYVKI